MMEKKINNNEIGLINTKNYGIEEKLLYKKKKNIRFYFTKIINSLFY